MRLATVLPHQAVSLVQSHYASVGITEDLLRRMRSPFGVCVGGAIVTQEQLRMMEQCQDEQHCTGSNVLLFGSIEVRFPPVRNPAADNSVVVMRRHLDVSESAKDGVRCTRQPCNALSEVESSRSNGGLRTAC